MGVFFCSVGCSRCLARLIAKVVTPHKLLGMPGIIQTAERQCISRRNGSATSGIPTQRDLLALSSL
jgi:hypothetical protein